MIARTFKYRCYPTVAQEHLLHAWQNACWEVQKLCILQRRIADHQLAIRVWGGVGKNRRGEPFERWQERTWRKDRPTWVSQSREVTQLRATDPALADVPADTMAAIVKRVDMAYQRMWSDRKKGRFTRVRWANRPVDIGLQFRGQAARGTVCVASEGRRSYWTLAGTAKRRGVGPFAVRMHRPLPEGTDVRLVSLTHEADGWYISFSCQIPDPAPEPPGTIDVLGLNLNCRHEGERQSVARFDTGRLYQIDDHAASASRRIGTLQKLTSPTRKTRGSARKADPNSKRTRKRQERVARIHQRIARQRKHQQHFVARRVIQQANVVAVEDTDYAALRRIEAKQHRYGERRAKRMTNRSMGRAAPGQMRLLIKEKAQTSGRTVVEVPEGNITQQCSVCDHVLDPPIGLDVIHWTCPSCGARHHRDTNAAANVKRRAVPKTG